MVTLQLIPDIRYTIAQVMRLAELVRLNVQDSFAMAIVDRDLIDYEWLGWFEQKLDKARNEGKLSLSDFEAAQFYLMLNLLCKSFFSSLEPVVRNLGLKTPRQEEYAQARSRILSTAERLMEAIDQKVDLKGQLGERMTRLEKLDTLLDF